MNKQQLANKIWESANKMRSKIEANEYKDYILGFIFYKYLSDYEIKKLSGGKHLSVNNPSIKCVAWNFSRWDEVDDSKDFSAIGMLDENIFMGNRSNQIIIEDFNFADNEIKNEISRNFHKDRVIWF